MNNEHKQRKQFSLGRVVATQGALAALERAEQRPDTFLQRHQSGDWGELSPEDAQLNEQAVAREGAPERQGRVLSAYLTEAGESLWVVTEWDRSLTTLLLPDEY